MQFILSQTEANRLEGLTTIVSSDRVGALMSVNLTFAVVDQEVRMTATATDSYRAAQQYFTLSRPDDQKEGAEIVLPSDRLVDGKGLREILKKARRNATVFLEFHDDTLEVRVFAGGTNTSSELKSDDFDFPDVQRFIDELPWDVETQAERSSTGAFNPTYLSQVPKMLGLLPRDSTPVRMVLNGDTKPAGFRVFKGSEVTAVGVLMAVRI